MIVMIENKLFSVVKEGGWIKFYHAYHSTYKLKSTNKIEVSSEQFSSIKISAYKDFIEVAFVEDHFLHAPLKNISKIFDNPKHDKLVKKMLNIYLLKDYPELFV
jgi:hypothetical protein